MSYVHVHVCDSHVHVHVCDSHVHVQCMYMYVLDNTLYNVYMHMQATRDIVKGRWKKKRERKRERERELLSYPCSCFEGPSHNMISRKLGVVHPDLRKR